MEGFLVLSGDATTRRSRQALEPGLKAIGWRLARANDAACLFTRDETPVRDLGEQWVVGELFVRGSGRPAPPRLEPPAAQEDPSWQAASHLVSGYWGRYVLVAPGARAVMRDPSGHMDCLAWESAIGWVAGSEIPDDLPALAMPIDLGLDWKQIAALARGQTTPGVRLGLVGVAPVLPGELKTLGSSGLGRLAWDPVIVASTPHASYEASRTAVALAVEESLAAELASGETILAEISGGLDSAIMSTTLARLGGGSRSRFVNFHASDPASDERPFARAVAGCAGVDLVELEKPEWVLDIAALENLPVAVRPSVNGVDRHYDAEMAAQAKASGAGRILTGQGGDIVFFQSPTPAIVSELWGPWLRRPRADPLWRQLETAARWNRRSVWSLLGEAAREAWGARPAPTGGDDHPWLSRDLPPAKARQVRSLARAQLFHGASLRGRQAKLIHPLLHQPVQEAVLAAPAIDLARNGQGRSLARDVFAAQLPDTVRYRRSKGDLTAYYGRMVLRSLPAIVPFLLEGRLAQEKVLDREEFEALLDPDRLIHEGDYPRLFEILILEAFVRHWEARVGSLAAGSGLARRSASQGRTSA